MTTAHDLRRPPISVAVLDLLERGRTTLETACRTSDASERYRDAHLGALRAAAALVAARTVPSPPQASTTSESCSSAFSAALVAAEPLLI